jgi:hypothetical protein
VAETSSAGAFAQLSTPEPLIHRATDAKPQSAERGHFPKIAEAVTALKLSGRWPPNLRAGERHRRVLEYLRGVGYDRDLPSRSALTRALRRVSA